MGDVPWYRGGMKKENKEFALEALKPGHYSVDPDGTVWTHKSGDKRRLAVGTHYMGYHYAYLFVKGKYKQIYTHHLVYLRYVGDIPEDLEINHKNGIKTDNTPSNLELVTHKENINHAVRIGLQEILFGETHGSSVLKEGDIRNIKYLSYLGPKCGFSQRKIAKIYGTCKSTIANIQSGKSWAHVKLD